MLAQDYEKHFKKIIFPAYIQPKLDGGRGIVVVELVPCSNASNGSKSSTFWQTTAWTRTRKKINSMQHITDDLAKFFNNGQQNTIVRHKIILDGEFYNHTLKDQFEELMSLLRQEEYEEKCNLLQYHIYDIVQVDNNENLTFEERLKVRDNLFKNADKQLQYIELVETKKIDNNTLLKQQYKQYTEQGYEGAIARNIKAIYEQDKRSYNLQKIKEFQEDEFKVIGLNEGKGKLAKHAASFICETTNGVQFNVKCDGELSKLKEYYDNHSLWQNKLLTVKYFSLIE